jgi:hypothetical protein
VKTQPKWFVMPGKQTNKQQLFINSPVILTEQLAVFVLQNIIFFEFFSIFSPSVIVFTVSCM